MVSQSSIDLYPTIDAKTWESASLTSVLGISPGREIRIRGAGGWNVGLARDSKKVSGKRGKHHKV